MERVSLDRSPDLYRSVAVAGSDPGPGMIEELGNGWIAEAKYQAEHERVRQWQEENDLL